MSVWLLFCWLYLIRLQKHRIHHDKCFCQLQLNHNGYIVSISILCVYVVSHKVSMGTGNIGDLHIKIQRKFWFTKLLYYTVLLSYLPFFLENPNLSYIANCIFLGSWENVFLVLCRIRIMYQNGHKNHCHWTIEQ